MIEERNVCRIAIAKSSIHVYTLLSGISMYKYISGMLLFFIPIDFIIIVLRFI